MDQSKYRVVWFRRTMAESLKFWTEHRIFAFILTPPIAAGSAAIVDSRLRQRPLSMETVIVALVAVPLVFAAMAMLRFAWDALRAPALIHQDTIDKLVALGSENEMLRTAQSVLQVSPDTEARARIVVEILANWSVAQKKLLRRIMVYKKVNGFTIDAEWGFNPNDVRAVLGQAGSHGLLSVGPTTSFNMDWYEAVNAVLRTENL